MEDTFDYHRLYKPKKKWYKKLWGIVVLSILSLFLSLSAASGMYVYYIYKCLKAGKCSGDQIFGTEEGLGNLNKVYGQNRPYIGSVSAPLTFVVFVDFECPFCKEASRSINALMLDELYKNKARFIIRHFPVTYLRPHALNASMAAECAYEQGKFLEMHNTLFDSQDNLSIHSLKRLAVQIGLNSIEFNTCLDSQKHLNVIESDMRDGIDLGVKSTPVFLIENKMIEGAPTIDNLKKAIDGLIK